MEQPISVSTLNDFIFCPASIYFHQMYEDMALSLFQSASNKSISRPVGSFFRLFYVDKPAIPPNIGTCLHFQTKKFLDGTLKVFIRSSLKTAHESRKNIRRLFLAGLEQASNDYYNTMVNSMVRVLRVVAFHL